MTTTLAEFEQKFRLNELEILRTDHWTWSLRPVQATVGAGVLSLNRFSASFADLSNDEAADLAAIVPQMEGALQKYAQPDRMNYLMLMMVDAHLHFHVLPRYAQARDLAGQDWVDSMWPGPPSLTDNSELDQVVLLVLRDELRALVYSA